MANKWGYNIKYVDPAPGCKLKRPMYEIKPGVWVIRSQLPEHKKQRKQRYWANPQKEKDSGAIYYSDPKNRTKALVKKRQFRKENKGLIYVSSSCASFICGFLLSPKSS